MKTLTVFLVASLMLVFTPSQARAPGLNLVASQQFHKTFNGNELLKSCNALLNSEQARRESDIAALASGLPCLYYTVGFMHGYAFGSRSAERGLNLFCLPENSENITGEQLARIIVKWAQEHPEKLHEGSPMVMLAALNTAFPCK